MSGIRKTPQAKSNTFHRNHLNRHELVQNKSSPNYGHMTYADGETGR